MTKAKRVANKIQKQFPNIKGINTCNFWDGNDNVIHLGDAAEGGMIDKDRAADYYAFEYDPKEEVYQLGVHLKLVAALEKEGYFAEWYDCGTLLACQL